MKQAVDKVKGEKKEKAELTEGAMSPTNQDGKRYLAVLNNDPYFSILLEPRPADVELRPSNSDIGKTLALVVQPPAGETIPRLIVLDDTMPGDTQVVPWADVIRVADHYRDCEGMTTIGNMVEENDEGDDDT